MITLTMRMYSGAADVQAIVDLCNAIEAIDQVGNGTSVAELQVDLANPMIDPARDIALWEDEDGKLAAMGVLWNHSANDRIEFVRLDACSPGCARDGARSRYN